jgi:DNA excision repair protein ERCC-6-like 2
MARLNAVDANDDETASEDDFVEVRDHAIPKKRKLAPGEEERLQWTDSEPDVADTASKKLKTKKVSSVAKGKRTAVGKRTGAAASRSKKSSKRDLQGYVDGVKELGQPESADDDLLDANIPDYLQERRREFDRNVKELSDRADTVVPDLDIVRQTGLKIPPDYSDLYFPDDAKPRSQWQIRPHFDEQSGVKPARANDDIMLENSAGVIPAPIARYLRDYQVDGVKFLHEAFVYQKGCILGDDMGLGKTVQVAAFLAAAFGKTGDQRDDKRMRKVRDEGGGRWYPRVLIVCPGSILQNWKNELNRWGWWHVDIYHGSRKTREDVLGAAAGGWLEVMLTTYETFAHHRDMVNTVEWDCVVADECHRVKERHTATTKSMNGVNALCRIGLTGTAIQNKYDELWTLLNWTNPGHFGSHLEWKGMITKPLTIGQSHDATQRQLSLARLTAQKLVQNLLPKFFLRRMKTLIADQLPKKSDKVVFCPLTDLQKQAYENYINSPNVEIIRRASELCPCGEGRKRGWCCFAQLPDGRPWFAIVFPTIMTLQKIANNLTLLIPSSIDVRATADKLNSELEALRTCLPDAWEDLWKKRDNISILANPEFCGKWVILKKLLRFWHEHGDKVLVFSHSVRLLRILQYLFQLRGTSCNVSYLDGSLGYEERQRVVDDFNCDPKQFVFLISTRAGGVGLNITSANKVVIFDPHWNPSWDLQAQDRAYRIGQVRDVDVFRLVSAGTIEEIVYARQIYKQQQANIGYNASTERRYFKGVQQDNTRKGEIFGLANLFSFDQVVLRDIVNKTNIAEAKAGVTLSEVDLESAVKDEDDGLNMIKQEDTDDGGMSQLAKILSAEDQEAHIKKTVKRNPQSDAIAAILASGGVEYTHQNSEVIGSSKVEEQLSRRAVAATHDGTDGEDSALFADTQANTIPIAPGGKVLQLRYNPPADVMRRQFCSMAREFGFKSATDFALVVESWTQAQRRDCLESFYKRREAILVKRESAAEEKNHVEQPIKNDPSEREVSDQETDDGSVHSSGKERHEAVEKSGREVKLEQDMKMEEVRSEVKIMGANTKASAIFLSDDEEDDEL